MARLIRNVLTKLITGKDNFCCICFKNIEFSGEAHFEDKSQFIHIFEILDFIFKDQTITALFRMGDICSSCKTSAIISYKLIKTFEENSNNLKNSIESITASLNNSVDLSECNTVIISLNVADHTTQNYYENIPVDNVVTAFKRFCVLTRPKEEIKILLSHVQHDPSTNMKAKKVITQTIPSDYYNIPSVHNSEIMLCGQTDYKCKRCSKSFRDLVKARRHFFKFHYPRNYKCPKCPQKCISTTMLKHHDSHSHHETVCSQCGKYFTNKYNLRKHKLNHNVHITCEICGRSYRSKESFKKHISDEVCKQKMRKTADQGTYCCNYCNKRYCYKPYLAKHIKFEHENAVGFKCGVCDKVFYTPSSLKVHSYKHTHEKKFKCEHCGGKFVTKTSLLYHTRLHTGDTPYKCEHCDKAFLSASRRLDHMRRHHMPPSLECELCHVKFKTTGSLLKHKKRHFNPNSRLNNQRPLV